MKRGARSRWVPWVASLATAAACGGRSVEDFSVSDSGGSAGKGATGSGGKPNGSGSGGTPATGGSDVSSTGGSMMADGGSVSVGGTDSNACPNEPFEAGLIDWCRPPVDVGSGGQGAGGQTSVEGGAPSVGGFENAGGDFSGGGSGSEFERVPIDDLEDGDRLTLPIPTSIDHWRGLWYVVNDASGGTQYPNPPCFSATNFVGEFGNHRAAEMQSSGFSVWGSVMGIALRSDFGCHDGFDASEYVGVSFRVRGKGLIHFGIETVETTPLEFDGTCEGQGCDNAFITPISLSDSWTRYDIPFDTLVQGAWGQQVDFDPSGLMALNFGAGVGATVDIWVDDIAFMKETH